MSPEECQQQHHVDELVRFISTANRAVVDGTIDSWTMRTERSQLTEGCVCFAIIATRGNEAIGFHAECPCNLADVFSASVRHLLVPNADTKGSELVGLRKNGRPYTH